MFQRWFSIAVLVAFLGIVSTGCGEKEKPIKVKDSGNTALKPPPPPGGGGTPD